MRINNKHIKLKIMFAFLFRKRTEREGEFLPLFYAFYVIENGRLVEARKREIFMIRAFLMDVGEIAKIALRRSRHRRRDNLRRGLTNKTVCTSVPPSIGKRNAFADTTRRSDELPLYLRLLVLSKQSSKSSPISKKRTWRLARVSCSNLEVATATSSLFRDFLHSPTFTYSR